MNKRNTYIFLGGFQPFCFSGVCMFLHEFFSHCVHNFTHSTFFRGSKLSLLGSKKLLQGQPLPGRDKSDTHLEGFGKSRDLQLAPFLIFFWKKCQGPSLLRCPKRFHRKIRLCGANKSYLIIPKPELLGHSGGI